jgi:hypothetical protein
MAKPAHHTSKVLTKSSQNIATIKSKVTHLKTEVPALKYAGEQVTIANYLLTRLKQLGVKVTLC